MGNRVIYRPAYEAEVEYLESDDNSYIDTGLKASSELGILAHIQVVRTQRRLLFGGANGHRDKELGFLFSTGGDSSYRYGTHYLELGSLSLNTTYEFDSTQNHNVMKVGSLTFTMGASTFTSDYNFYLFAENRNDIPISASGVRIYDFKIYQNSTLVRDFIPVRIGQVGYMYDKVSKQLFANKGTGNFILGNDVSNAVIPQQRCVLYFGSQRSMVFERIYEEYQWLIGDGTAYIKGIQYNLWDNHIALRVGKRQNPRSIMSYSGGTDKGFLQIIVNTDSGQSEPYLMVAFRELNSPAIHIADIRPFSSMPDIVDMDFYISNSTFYCDQNGVIKTNNPSQTAVESSWSSITPKIQSSKMSYIREVLHNDTYRSNLVPCKLLHSIPAILDGNGIARQVGECGMWDKVNDKFYGNVASSGSFTVSND